MFLKWLAVFLFFALVCTFLFWGPAYHWEPVWTYRQIFLQGFVHTVLIALTSLVLSLFFGLIWNFSRRSSIFFLSSLAKICIELIRGTPFLVQILFFYYVVAHQAGLQNRYVAGVLILSIFSSAYMAEIFRASIESVGSTQIETAKAIGLTPFQTYSVIILPQALRQTLPPLAGQLASLIKDSSLLSVIGIYEMTFAAEQVSSITFSTLESYFPLAFGYLILTLPISLWSKTLEKKFSYEH